MTAGSATFGDLLRRHRLAAGLTQEELAERAQVSPRAISDLERGLRTRPWRDTIHLLTNALKLEATERADLELAARRPGSSSADPLQHGGSMDGAGSRTTLPTVLTRLIGREQETARTEDLLRRADVRLVTLTGPGGIGKTSLALQIAADLSNDFADGIFFVPLDLIGTPNLVGPSIAQTIGVKESAGQPLVETLKEALRGRELLLVLDNFEHVDAAAPLVSDVLSSCPRVKVLVTSRSPLHLRREHESPVPPLGLPPLPVSSLSAPLEEVGRADAVRLFVERAKVGKPDFALTSHNAVAIAEICHRLDGLPLAIELAAARIKVLSPAELLDRLANRLGILTGGPRDLPARQQTLRNTIAWSYDLLDEGEKALFRRLSVFTGGCTLDAVEAVCGDLSLNLLDRLTSLVDHSILQRDETSETARFSMLETMREYGVALLAASGEEKVIAEQHAGYFLTLVDDCVSRYTSAGPGSLTWDSRLGREQANLRATVAWFRDNDPALGLRLAAGLGWYWVEHADLAEAEEWLTTFLARTSGEPGVRGRVLLALATLKRDRGDLSGAQPLFEEGLALCREGGDRWGIARGLNMLAHQARRAGDYERAIAFGEESLAIAREIGVLDSLMWGLTLLVEIHRLRGDFGRAREFLEEARRLAPREFFPIFQLGLTAEDEGDYGRADAVFQDGLAQEKPATRYVGEWQLHLARVNRKRGDRIRARRWCEEAIARARQTGRNVYVCLALYELAVLDWGDNDPVGGHARLAEGLGLARQDRDRQALAFGLLLGANHASEMGAFVRAIRLFGAADLIVPGYRFEWDHFDRATYERSLAAARAALDPDVAASAWAEGQAMTPEQAIAYALDEGGT